MFQTNQQIGVYTLIQLIKRGDFSEVWVAGIIDKVNIHKYIYWLIEVGLVNGQIVILSQSQGADSLFEKLQTQPKFSTEQAIKITIGILDGLNHLYKKGINHGKLNPRNIFLQNETPILADFGFEDVVDEEMIPPTDRLFYLAPEALANNENCKVQTDIWSVGVILYQLLSGKLPFPQKEISERLIAIITSEFTPLPDETPVQLKEIVRVALAKNPENRYQSTEAMRESLKKALNFIKNLAANPTQKFLRPSYPELMYPGSLVVEGRTSHSTTGGSVSEIAVAFDSQETVIAFYEKKFGKGQNKPEDGAVEWKWEENLGSLRGYKMVSVYHESFITSFTEQWRLQIPANTRAIIFIYSNHW